MADNRGPVGTGHCSRQRLWEATPPPWAQRPWTEWEGRGQGSRKQGSAGRALSHSCLFAPFLLLCPQFRRIGREIPECLQLNRHQPEFLIARDTDKMPGPRSHPCPLFCWTLHRQSPEKGKSEGSALHHLIPLTPFSNPGPILFTAHDQLKQGWGAWRRHKRQHLCLQDSNPVTPSVPPVYSAEHWVEKETTGDVSACHQLPPEPPCSHPNQTLHCPQSLLLLPVVLLKLCQDHTLKEIKTNSL